MTSKFSTSSSVLARATDLMLMFFYCTELFVCFPGVTTLWLHFSQPRRGL